MTPEVQALIARVRELDARATQGPLEVWEHGAGDSAPIYRLRAPGHRRIAYAATRQFADLIAFFRTAAPQLTTALEAAEKRADAEKKRGDQMEQTASAFSNLMMNCADTLRSRGIDAAVGPLDIRVIELAKRADAAERDKAALRELFYLNPNALYSRIEAAEAKLKVATEALAMIRAGLCYPDEYRTVADTALAQLTEPETESK